MLHVTNDDEILFILYVMLFCIGSPHLSHWMDNYQGLARFGIAFDISFLFDIIYISVFFIFMCQCVYFMLLLLYMFRNLKKMNILCIFYACRYLPIFCRYFADIFADIADKIFSGPSLIFSRYRYYQHCFLLHARCTRCIKYHVAVPCMLLYQYFLVALSIMLLSQY